METSFSLSDAASYHPWVLQNLYPSHVAETAIDQDEGESIVNAALRSLDNEGSLEIRERRTFTYLDRTVIGIARLAHLFFVGLIAAPAGVAFNGARTLAALSCLCVGGSKDRVTKCALATLNDFKNFFYLGATVGFCALTFSPFFVPAVTFKVFVTALAGAFTIFTIAHPDSPPAALEMCFTTQRINGRTTWLLRQEFGLVNSNGGLLAPNLQKTVEYRGDTIVGGPLDDLIIHHEKRLVQALMQIKQGENGEMIEISLPNNTKEIQESYPETEAARLAQVVEHLKELNKRVFVKKKLDEAGVRMDLDKCYLSEDAFTTLIAKR